MKLRYWPTCARFQVHADGLSSTMMSLKHQLKERGGRTNGSKCWVDGGAHHCAIHPIRHGNMPPFGHTPTTRIQPNSPRESNDREGWRLRGEARSCARKAYGGGAVGAS